MTRSNAFLSLARALGMASFTCAAAIALAKPQVTAVQIDNQPTRLSIRIVGKELSDPKLIKWDTNGYIAEFNGSLKGKSRTLKLDSTFANFVNYRADKSNAGKVRVSVSLKENAFLAIEPSEDGSFTIVVESVKKVAAHTIGGYDPSLINQPETLTLDSSDAIPPASAHDHKETTGGEKKSVKAAPKSTKTAGKKPAASKSAKTNRVKSATPTEVAAATGGADATPPTLAAYYNGIVSLDFVDAEIGNVLKALAIQSGANIVTGPDVKGTVTVSLANVSVENALDLITKLSNLKYAKLDNTYVVGTPQNIQQMMPQPEQPKPTAPSSVVEVVRINYGDLNVIKQAVQSMMDELAEEEEFSVFGSDEKKASKGSGEAGGSGSSGGSESEGDDPRNDRYLVLAGSPSIIGMAKSIAQELDRRYADARVAGQVISIYHTKHTDALKLKSVLEGKVEDQSKAMSGGSGGDAGSSGGGGESGGSEQTKSFPLFPTVRYSLGPNPSVSNHATSVTQVATNGAAGASTGGAGSASAGGSGTATTTPEPPLALIMQGPEEDVKLAMQFAERIDVAAPQVRIEAKVIDINVTDLKQVGFNISYFSDTAGSRTGDTTSTTLPGVFDRTNPTFSFGQVIGNGLLNVNLRALFERGNSRLLANPNVSVLDGRYAEIFIGDEIKYIESITQSTTGQNIQVGTVKAGIQLNVAPRISVENGTITMNIHPEVSLVRGFIDNPGGGTLPQIARRFADTTVRVKDGETIVIGGLIREDDIRTIQKVPILGDLPILGYLFRKEIKDKTRNEVVIFITPTIVKE